MITITWGSQDKSILQYTFEDSWAIDDLIEALDAGVEVTHRYDHDIDVIVDLSRSGLPNLFGTNLTNAFSRAAHRTDEHYENAGKKDAGMVVIVSNNSIIRNALLTMMSLYKRMGDQISLANSVAEAQQIIANARQEYNERMTA